LPYQKASHNIFYYLELDLSVPAPDFALEQGARVRAAQHIQTYNIFQ